MCWWSGNLEKKEKEKEEKGEKKRIQLALHLEIYIQPFRNILTPFRNLVISKYYYLPRIDLLDKVAWKDMYVVEFNKSWHVLRMVMMHFCEKNSIFILLITMLI